MFTPVYAHLFYGGMSGWHDHPPRTGELFTFFLSLSLCVSLSLSVLTAIFLQKGGPGITGTRMSPCGIIWSKG